MRDEGKDSAENNAVYSEAVDVIQDEIAGSRCRHDLKIVGRSEEIVNSPELVDMLRKACIKTGHGFLETAPFSASETQALLSGRSGEKEAARFISFSETIHAPATTPQSLTWTSHRL